MKKSKKKLWAAACMAAALALVPAGTSLADDEVSGAQPRNEWINMEKGPGVAQWVDADGTVTEQTGVKPGENSQPQPQGPAYGDASQGTTESEGAQGTEEGGQAQGTQEGQPEGEQSQGAAEGEQSQAAAEGDQSQGAAEGEQSQEAAAGDQAAEGQPAASGRVIDPSRPMVALTFDDGPYAPVGNQIMDCLARYGGKATFYVVGNRCAGYAAEMQRMVAEGHEVGNHTYEHKYLNKLDAAQIQYQVNKGSEAIQASCGVAPATFRLPGGSKNATVLANIGAPIIMWSIDTLDWKTKDTQTTVNKVLGSVRDGDIVLMHELYAATGNAAVQIIPALVERGYQLVTVSELAQYRGGLQGGQIYSAFRP